MNILNSLFLCFAMFSRIPMPRTNYAKGNMRFMLAFFPLVGLVVGLFGSVWGYVADLLSVSSLLQGIGFLCIPILLTGGIHLDGFCDTSDALASNAPPERKQEILKDPQIGAFAAIYLVIYAIAYTGFAAEASCTKVFLASYVALHVLSRSLSGLAMVFFPCARNSGLVHSFADAAARTANRIILCFWGVAAAGILLIVGGPAGLGALLLSFTVFFIYQQMAKRQFHGISGDLAGWFLQLCELVGLAALALLPQIY